MFCVLPYVILFLLALRLPRLGKRELILVLFVRFFDLCLFGFVGFLFLLVTGKGCGLWLWHSLDFSLTFFLFYWPFYCRGPGISLTLCCFLVCSTRRFVLILAFCYFVFLFFSPLSIAITSLGEERANLCFLYLCSICSYMVLSTFSWCLGKAAACDCDTSWTFLLPFLWLFFRHIQKVIYRNCINRLICFCFCFFLIGDFMADSANRDQLLWSRSMRFVNVRYGR